MVAAILLSLIAPVPPAPPKEVTPAIEKKLVGDWKGEGPCDGRLFFRADGTFSRTDYGPGGISMTGTWKVRWDALPPTLILTQKIEDGSVSEKPREVKLLRLDDLVLEYGSEGSRDGVIYRRAKK